MIGELYFLAATGLARECFTKTVVIWLLMKGRGKKHHWISGHTHNFFVSINGDKELNILVYQSY